MSVKAMECKSNRFPCHKRPVSERMPLSDNESPYCIQGSGWEWRYLPPAPDDGFYVRNRGPGVLRKRAFDYQ